MDEEPLNKPDQISWVLASHDPSRLAAFYSRLLNRDAAPGWSATHWVIDLAEGLSLEIYRPSRQRPFPDRGRHLAPCLRLKASADPLTHLQGMLPHWLAAGASIAESPRLESFGAECWLLDPEENAVLVVVPAVSKR
ncbi:VOC family protein [Parasynechococcus sp.]|uniref:VOC family protein n=1 Tax=Parasynechococcus sp. TaxID=3101203 RepID=UPI0037044D25